MVTLGKVFSWSFLACFEGNHPSCDPWGNALQVTGWNLQGSLFARKMTCLVWAAPADCTILLSMASQNTIPMSPVCAANATDLMCLGVMLTQTQLGGASHTARRNPRNLSGVSHFAFAYDFMHCADLGFSSACVANVFYEDAGMFFSDQEFADYTRSANRFPQYYKLSDWSFRLQNCRLGPFQWGQLQKMHFLSRFERMAVVVWAYPGEHLAGNAARLASAYLSGLQAYQVPKTVCRKYQIGKHLQFLQLS